MSPKKFYQNAQVDGVDPIKADIQSLARQLWIAKRNTTAGVDWLVDWRLMSQLNELSKGQLLRVKRLLARSVGKARPDRKYRTGSPV